MHREFLKHPNVTPVSEVIPFHETKGVASPEQVHVATFQLRSN